MIDDKTPIRGLCEEYGMTQAGLAEKFGIPRRTVEDWATGRRKPPEYVVNMMEKLLKIEKKM